MDKMKWFVAGLAVLVLAAAGTMFLGQKPKVTEISVALPTEVNKNINVYENEYLYFEYPQKYSLVNLPIRDGRVYTYVSFEGGLDVTKMELIFRESTQDLNGLPDVKMRRANNYQYSEEVARIGEERGLLFRTADWKERVVYLMKKGRLLQVTMITVGPYSDEYENEFQNILKTVIWK